MAPSHHVHKRLIWKRRCVSFSCEIPIWRSRWLHDYWRKWVTNLLQTYMLLRLSFRANRISLSSRSSTQNRWYFSSLAKNKLVTLGLSRVRSNKRRIHWILPSKPRSKNLTMRSTIAHSVRWAVKSYAFGRPLAQSLETKNQSPYFSEQDVASPEHNRWVSNIVI